MTIANQTASVTYTGNGVQTTFVYNFLIPYQFDGSTPAVAVYLIVDDVETLLAPSEYVITGVASTLGGTVIYSPAIDSSTQIRIDRALAYTQEMAFPNQGFYPQSVEEMGDNLAMQIQQLAAALGVSDNVVQPQLEAFPFALTNETTAITDTGTYITFEWPYNWNITDLYASLTTVSALGDMTIDIAVNTVSILSTPITIEEGELSSRNAAVQPVVSSPSIGSGDVVTIVLSAAGDSATGLKVVLLGRQS